MKKLLLTLGLSALIMASLSAEIDKPKRWFEVGMDLDASVSENLLGLTEVMHKDLVIDLPDIYRKMGNGGFKFNLGMRPSYFMNFFIDGWGIGTKTEVNYAASLGISKDLFKILAEGTDLDEDMQIGFSFNMQSFLSQSLSLGFNVGDFRVKVTPSYYLPLIYLPDPHTVLNIRMDSDGKISGNMEGVFELYSIVDLSSGIEGETFSTDAIAEAFSSLDSSEVLDQMKEVIIKGAGIDLSASVQYPLLEDLDLGAYTTIPIIPGTLHNKISGGVTFSAVSEEGILDWLTSNDENKGDNPFNIEGPNQTPMTAEKAEYRVSRPFRLGVEAAWRPIGNWFVLHPMLGVAMRNPVGDEGFALDRIYPEYRLALDMTFLYVLGLSVSTQYIDQVFAHTIGLSLNTRILELDASVGVCGADFLKSFTIRGVQANVGFRIGI